MGPILLVGGTAGGFALWGLPLSHDSQLLWILYALACLSLTDPRRWLRGALLDWLPLMAILVAYDLLRGAADGLVSAPHTMPQIDVGHFLFGGQVLSVRFQDWLYTPGHLHFWDYGMWVTYMSHFFATVVILLILWRWAYPRFRELRAMVVVLTFAGFATYVLFPATPPWLAAYDGVLPPVQRVVGEVWGQLGVPAASAVFEHGSQYVNDVAAMPSLHAAYPMLFLAFFWSRGWRWRIGFGAYVLAMAFTLLYGGEHYALDIVVGWLYAVATFLGTRAVRRWWTRRRALEPDGAVEPAPRTGSSIEPGLAARR